MKIKINQYDYGNLTALLILARNEEALNQSQLIKGF